MATKEKTIYDLELHEELCITQDTSLLYYRRCPGGWLFSEWIKRKQNDVKIITPTFIPFNNEFQTPKNES